MRKVVWAAIIAAAVGVGEANAQGVLPLSVEVRGGFAMPTGEWNEEDDIETGTGFGVNVQFQATPMIGLYAGWERYQFGIDEGEPIPGLEDFEVDATDQGFRGGAEVSLPLGMLTGLSPFVFGGVIYNQLSSGISDGSSSIEMESDRELGFEAGAGVAIPLGLVVSFTPAVRYRSHGASFEEFGEEAETTVSYWSIDLGLRLGF